MSKRKSARADVVEQPGKSNRNIAFVAMIGLVAAGAVSFGVANAQLPPVEWRNQQRHSPGDSFFDFDRVRNNPSNRSRNFVRSEQQSGMDESKFDPAHYSIGKKQIALNDIVVEMTEVRPKDSYVDERGSTGEGWLLVKQIDTENTGRKHGSIRMHFGDLNNSPAFTGMAAPITQPFSDRVIVVRGGGSNPQLMIIHRGVKLQGVQGGSFFATPDKRFLVVLNQNDFAPAVTVYDATQDKSLPTSSIETKSGIKDVRILEKDNRYFVVGTDYHKDWLVGWQFDPMTATLEQYSGNKEMLATAKSVPWLFDINSVPDECRVLAPEKEVPKTL